MDTTSLNLNITININPILLWIAFAIMLVILSVVSLVLVYHWKQYAFNKPVLAKAVLIYFIVSGSLSILGIISLLLYQFSIV